jgi:hypothetical protein
VSELRRLTIIALPCWLLWTALIVIAAPNQPSGAAQIVFLVSMALALVGGVWACWNALPQHTGKPWRRAATIAIGIAAFAVILFVGHTIGISLAATLSG